MRRTALGGLVVAAALIAGCGATIADPQTPAPSTGSASVLTPTPASSAVPSSAPRATSTSSSASRISSSRRATTTATARPSTPVSTSATPTDLELAAAQVKRMTTLEQAASVLMPAATQVLAEHRATNATGTNSTTGTGSADGTASDPAPGGAIVMGSLGVPDGTANGTPAEVADLIERIQAARPAGTPPLLIGTDQEYGDVVRLANGFTAFPGASALAAVPDTGRAVELTEQVTAAAAAELLAVGVTVDFAPVADLLPADGSPSAIGDRSFGSDPDRVAALVSAAVKGFQSTGLAATVKHFPGIGGIAADTHETLPTLPVDCEQWNAGDAVPMRAGVRAGVDLVMTGHVLMPAAGVTDVPASLSPTVVTDLLKGKGRDGCTGLGFDGVAVTDSLQMQPVLDAAGNGTSAEVAALAAGEDLLLLVGDTASSAEVIAAAVESGELPAQRLADAATRVYALRLALARVPRPSMDVVGSAEHQALADEAAAAAAG